MAEQFMDAASAGADAGRPAGNGMDDQTLLQLHKDQKRESFEHRWIWERGWMRNIHYTNNRHWITYVRSANQWRDVKLAKFIPKPVTPLISSGVQAMRAMFASVNIGATVRPMGVDPKNVAVAALCDDFQPVLHEEHQIDEVMNESDFWFIVCGTSFLHTFLEKDIKHGSTVIPFETCVACQQVYSSDQIAEAGGKCAECGAIDFVPAMDPETGEPLTKTIITGKGVTIALSPFELAFPQTYARFDDVPYVIRLRWRNKKHYTDNAVLAPQVLNVKWAKAPSEQALQLFRSLPFHNDMGVAPFLDSLGGGSSSDEEGAPEYEHWIRPCDAYPKGLVFRVVGDSDPVVLHVEDEEGLPGPIPYVDVDGNPVFTFTCGAFEQRGGRVYGTSPLDAAIPIMNKINQLDSFFQMIVNRTANPLWLVPKGAEIQRFTGEPGHVVRWNPLTVGGNAKPERLDGKGVDGSLFQLREMYMTDIEEAMGTFDVLKGGKPSGVEAFSAMQLLVERAQGRYSSAFKSRGRMYRDWLKFALEIEREFGPDKRTQAILTPARKWTQKVFENTNLQGSFTVLVEDGSTTPKTALGMRAATEHLNQMGLINKDDPDQVYAIYKQFGQTQLAPSLDIHMQAALRKQNAFEEWANNDEAIQQSIQKSMQGMQEYAATLAQMPEPVADPLTGIAPPAAIPPAPSPNAHTPLSWKPWYSAPIHKQEFLKWANSDVIQELLEKNPALEVLLTAHLMDIDNALMQAQAQAAGPQPAPKPGGGAGQAMRNSNQESGGVQNASDNTNKPGAA